MASTNTFLNHQSLFQFLDADGSGGIDQHELLAGLGLWLNDHVSPLTRLSLLYYSFDANSDGVLQRSEFQALIKAYSLNKVVVLKGEEGAKWLDLFDVLDTNGDGIVSLEDFVSFVQSHDELKELFLSSSSDL